MRKKYMKVCVYATQLQTSYHCLAAATGQFGSGFSENFPKDGDIVRVEVISAPDGALPNWSFNFYKEIQEPEENKEEKGKDCEGETPTFADLRPRSELGFPRCPEGSYSEDGTWRRPFNW